MSDSSAGERLTPPPSPFMAQYLAAKADHPDALLFFRMGDFYELFFEDARKAAATLDITLTRRGQHKGEEIPMAGVPVHAAEGYLHRLIKAGHRVAVCEQMEDPAEARKRGSKSIVRREVVRLVTPGTLTEDGLLESRAANLLCAMALDGEAAALAWADVSTGAFAVKSAPLESLDDLLAGLAPAELLVPDTQVERLAAEARARGAGAALTVRPAAKADPRFGERRLRAVFEVAVLDAFGAFTSVEFGAIGLVLDYVELTQAGAAPRLEPPTRLADASFVAIDPATRASLEIERSQRGARDGSLLACVDRTVTAAGGRLLADRLGRPLTAIADIAARQDSVEWLGDGARRRAVREALRQGADVARALQRLALGRGGPRDLGALRDGLAAGARAAAAAAGAEAPAEVLSAIAALAPAAQPELDALASDLARALAPELGALVRDGGFVAPGFDVALDTVRTLRDDSRAVVAALQARYAGETGLPLKVRHNNVLGYHVEATPKQAEALTRPPHAALFQHRQTTATSVRFTTAELVELDARIARAGEEALAREAEIFAAFAARAADLAGPIRGAAEAMAVLDVAAANAEWAAETDGVRPELASGAGLLIEGGRHPVVEAALRRQGQGFTPNDCRLDGEGLSAPRLTLITGPNMAGKSTFLRQTAVLVLLAQAGLFVPARRLRLGPVDRIFSRVGASDDLARGRSTFMTEMVETAAILRQAGPQALVILDEIGRGTATYDGLAIAWGAVEHLHDVNRCRALFATHYHELTGLAERLPGAANASLRAREWNGDLVFLHEVAPGPADRSYGIQVARLAGLPRRAVERAKAVLARLEAGQGARAVAGMDDLPLFAALAPEPAPSGPPSGAPLGPPAPSPLERALAELDPDSLTPRAALEALYALKALLPAKES